MVGWQRGPRNEYRLYSLACRVGHTTTMSLVLGKCSAVSHKSWEWRMSHWFVLCHDLATWIPGKSLTCANDLWRQWESPMQSSAMAEVILWSFQCACSHKNSSLAWANPGITQSWRGRVSYASLCGMFCIFLCTTRISSLPYTFWHTSLVTPMEFSCLFSVVVPSKL